MSWIVALFERSEGEYKALAEFNTKLNAQLYAENYVLGYIAEQDGTDKLRGVNIDKLIVNRAHIDSVVKDLNLSKYAAHFVLRDVAPWGFTVNKVVVATTTVKTVTSTEEPEEYEVDEEFEATREVMVPSGKWFGPKEVKQTVREKQMRKVKATRMVAVERTDTTENRTAKQVDVFSIVLVRGFASVDKSERREFSQLTKLTAVHLANRVKGTDAFKLVGDELYSIKHIRDNHPSDFGKYKHVHQWIEFTAPADAWVGLKRPDPDTEKSYFSNDPTTYSFSNGPIKSSNTDVKRVSPLAALAGLHNDILIRRNEIFNKTKSIQSNVCNNIVQLNEVPKNDNIISGTILPSAALTPSNAMNEMYGMVSTITSNKVADAVNVSDDCWDDDWSEKIEWTDVGLALNEQKVADAINGVRGSNPFDDETMNVLFDEIERNITDLDNEFNYSDELDCDESGSDTDELESDASSEETDSDADDPIEESDDEKSESE